MSNAPQFRRYIDSDDNTTFFLPEEFIGTGTTAPTVAALKPMLVQFGKVLDAMCYYTGTDNPEDPSIATYSIDRRGNVTQLGAGEDSGASGPAPTPHKWADGADPHHAYYDNFVGIGVQPNAQLHVNDFSRLGRKAPDVQQELILGSLNDHAAPAVKFSHNAGNAVAIMSVDITFVKHHSLYVHGNTTENNGEYDIETWWDNNFVYVQAIGSGVVSGTKAKCFIQYTKA